MSQLRSSERAGAGGRLDRASGRLPRAGNHGGGAATDPDAASVARVRAGDALAFEALFRAYYRPLTGFVLGYVHSRGIAEELAQDVLCRVWEQRITWEVGGTVRGYLYAAARHRALDYLKHRRVAERWESTWSGGADAAPPGMGEPSAPADAEVRAEELMVAAARVIAALPDRCRHAYTLRRQHGLAYAEIARVMRLSIKRVEFLLTQAHRTLQTQLADYL